jgi:hypothetical protein
MDQSSSDVWDEPQQAQLIAQILSGALSLTAACQLHGLSVETVRKWVPVYRHRTLQALDEKLQAASLLDGASTERLGNAAYSGSLDDIAVADLLQTCHLGAKDCVITITRNDEQSSIWCERGVIVHASSGRLRGEAALYRILNFDSGQVWADFRLEASARTITLPCQALLLEAARHKDECAQLISQLRGLHAILTLAPGAWAANTTLTEREVLHLCNGERSVSEVLAQIEVADLDALQLIVSLVERGYLLREGTSTRPGPVASPSSSGDWRRQSSIYLPIPQPRHSSRRSRSATLLIALGLALGLLLWFVVETIYRRMPIGLAAADISGRDLGTESAEVAAPRCLPSPG